MVGGLKGLAGHKLGRETKEIDEQEAGKKENKGKAGCSGLHGFLHGLSYEGVSKAFSEGFGGRESSGFCPEDLCP